MEHRKVFKTAGGKAYGLTLPKEWAEQLGTREVLLIERGPVLIVVPRDVEKAVAETVTKLLLEGGAPAWSAGGGASDGGGAPNR